MATLAAGRQALEDLEGLLLRLACRPVVGVEELGRMGYDLQVAASGYQVVEKYLRKMREEGWGGTEAE
jgi:hypothetical protein